MKSFSVAEELGWIHPALTPHLCNIQQTCHPHLLKSDFLVHRPQF